MKYFQAGNPIKALERDGTWTCSMSCRACGRNGCFGHFGGAGARVALCAVRRRPPEVQDSKPVEAG
jgi:hypothetical protein